MNLLYTVAMCCPGYPDMQCDLEHKTVIDFYFFLSSRRTFFLTVKDYTIVILHPHLLQYTLTHQMQPSDPFSSPITAHVFDSHSLSFIHPKACSTSFCPQLKMLILALAESQLLFNVAQKWGGSAQPLGSNCHLGISH